MSDKYNDFKNHPEASFLVLCKHNGEGDFKTMHWDTSEAGCLAFIKVHRQGDPLNEYKIKAKGVD